MNVAQKFSTLNADEKLQWAVTNLAIQQPFLARINGELKWKVADNIPTACTDGKTVWFGRAFLERLTREEVAFIVAHEVLHVALKHHLRMKKHHEAKLSNVAMDYVINKILKEIIDGEISRRGKSCMSIVEGALLDDRFTSAMGWEDVYRILANEQKDKPEDQRDIGTPQDGKGQPQDGKGQPQDGDGNGQGQEGYTDVGGCGGVVRPTDGQGNDLSPTELGDLEGELDIAIEQAEKQSQGRGLCPSALSNIAVENRKHVIDWKPIFKRFVSKIKKGGYTFSRLNKKYQSRGLTLPSRRKTGTGRLSLLFDTSGSMGREACERILNEIEPIINGLQPELVTIHYYTMDVWTTQEFKSGQKFTMPDEWMSGGTDFDAPFNAVLAQKKAPKCIVNFTDMQAPMPKDPKIPTLWVNVTADDAVGSFGKTIKMEG